MGISKASAQWEGGFKTGKGLMKPAHGGDIQFTAGSRFEGQPSSNPEELIGAALAGCFSMALSANLEKAGHPAKRVDTTANVKLEMVDGAPKITTIELENESEVPGINEQTFREQADKTKTGCPVSKALTGTEIKLNAKLKS